MMTLLEHLVLFGFFSRAFELGPSRWPSARGIFRGYGGIGFLLRTFEAELYWFDQTCVQLG